MSYQTYTKIKNAQSTREIAEVLNRMYQRAGIDQDDTASQMTFILSNIEVRELFEAAFERCSEVCSESGYEKWGEQL
jgi:transcription initiation factor IIE alpha subunit